MAAPPTARTGTPATSSERPLVAGVAPFERLLGPRTSVYDLWTPLRVLATDVGRERLEALHDVKFDDAAFQRFMAFLRQAEGLYMAADAMPPEPRPLAAYYFMLNLTKSYLTCVDPQLTAQKVVHGLGDDFQRKQRYWFIHEQVKIHGARSATDALHELSAHTGTGYAYSGGTQLQVQRLAPYLAETVDVFQDAVGQPPKLVPAAHVGVWSNGAEAWLRVEVDRGELARRGLGPESLPKRAAIFGSSFRLVQSPMPTASYETKTTVAYGNRRILDQRDQLHDAFERTLIHVNRGSSGARYLIVISDRSQLLSQEAVAFVVMYHLSNMVRYRPEQIAKLSTQGWFFLFTTWVPRAAENFLLAMTSRIVKEEFRIGLSAGGGAKT